MRKIEAGLRWDCRTAECSRPVSVQHTKQVTTVKIGGTKAIAHCKAAVTRPMSLTASAGILSFSCEITAMADATQNAANKELESHISKSLDKAIRKSQAVDTESLVIIPGELVWNISCHVKVIDNDGNSTDASLIAAITALLGFKRPDVSIDAGQVIVHPETEKYPIPLTFHHIPVPTTFSLLESEAGLVPVLDPLLQEEEEGSSTLITICSNLHRQLVSQSSFGSLKYGPEILFKCTALAVERSRALTESIRNAVFINRS